MAAEPLLDPAFPPPGERPTESLWRNSAFVRVFSAATVSIFGSLITRVALPFVAIISLQADSVGVALDGKAMPNLPPSMVQILGNTRRTGAQAMGGALVSRQRTEWVIQGYESARFTVTKNKKVIAQK